MKRGKYLHIEKIKDHKNSNNIDINLAVYGIFDTEKVKWRYYVISYYAQQNGGVRLTNDVCSYATDGNLESVSRYGREFTTKEEGIKFTKEYKIKWETGSNNTTEELRDKKLDDILGDEDK